MVIKVESKNHIGTGECLMRIAFLSLSCQCNQPSHSDCHESLQVAHNPIVFIDSLSLETFRELLSYDAIGNLSIALW